MRRDWLGSLGLALVCVAAVVASFSTLASLAAVAGWGERASWLLPVCLDALGMIACRVWLSKAAPAPARTYAKWIALVTVGVSIVGNAAGHLAATGHLSQGILLVVLVGAVPPAGLAAGIHLAVLRGKTAEEVPVPDAAPVLAEKPGSTDAVAEKKSPVKKAAPKPSPKPVPKSAPDSGPEVDDLLMQKARHVAEQYEAKHGKAPSRDDLKTELGVGTTKATAVAAALKKEREVA
jgi:hypothetical protein